MGRDKWLKITKIWKKIKGHHRSEQEKQQKANKTDYLRTLENKKGKNKWQNWICIKINIIYALKNIFTIITK